ncbi:hypothetical protein DEU56DRAFT_961506 [Suillus clintonianus]|uniref:uncharacterized protein n=1 Tax=Suillus clintonianus TaxID=1904413 RepID=UPI001B8607D9|nr:uncharacterized protein DEU56DRAFT_961506 [Suillus clintonianus]KAG2125695.1 hypothetical protein DEU56DRAFT_961506 [Suillus clintonianus]
MVVDTDTSSVPYGHCFVSSAYSLPSFPDGTANNCSDREIAHTGEQINHVLLEHILMEDPMIRGAIIFHAYQHLGVLVDPQMDDVIDVGDKEKLTAFKRYIQLALDPTNMSPPPHMVIVASVLKPWKYVEDGTPDRQSIVAEYAPEIVSLNESVSTPITPPAVLTPRKPFKFVRRLVKTTLIKSDIENIIEYGIDGLPATKARPFLLETSRTTNKIDIHKSSDNIVHRHPVVISLRKRAKMYLSRCLVVVNMARTYVTSSSARQPSHGPLLRETILLTDSTSTLGASLLVKLLDCETTARVYALVTKDTSSDSFAERQSKILKKIGFGEDLIHHKKLVLVDGDACDEDTAIPQEHFAEVVASTTHHTRSPLPLPPRFVVVSSPALFANSRCRVPLENYPADYFDAVGWVFIESIWVAQQRLSVNASLRPIMISFDQHHKAFRYGRGWLSAIARTCLCVGAVPDASRMFSWVPMGSAATALIEMYNSPSPCPILHIAPPNPTLRARSFAGRLGLPLIPLDEWLSRFDGFASRDSGDQPVLYLIEMLRRESAHGFVSVEEMPTVVSRYPWIPMPCW